jgi:uncharacterized ion transporter superfamily protein YfcC
MVFTLLALAVVVIAAVATWLTIPAGRYEEKDLTALIPDGQRPRRCRRR